MTTAATIAAIPAPWNAARDHGKHWTEQPRYWTVSKGRTRYWVGPASGPAAHVHHAQALELARHLNTTATRSTRTRTRQPGRPAGQRARRSAQKGPS